jgi:hypothetical protein
LPHDANRVVLPEEASALYQEYCSASADAAYWKDKTEKLKARLLGMLGVAPDDPKPPSLTGVDADGTPVYRLMVGNRRGLDTGYLRTRHPDVYAECERMTKTKSIKEPENDG